VVKNDSNDTVFQKAELLRYGGLTLLLNTMLNSRASVSVPQ